MKISKRRTKTESRKASPPMSPRMRAGLKLAVLLIGTGTVVGKPLMARSKRIMRPVIPPGDVSFHMDFSVLSPMRGTLGYRGAGSVSASIAAVPEGVITLDSETGVLSLLDTTGKRIFSKTLRGKKKGQGDFAVGQLAVDAAGDRVYVADRAGDRLRVFSYQESLRSKNHKGFVELNSVETAAEPFAVALAPDRSSVLVLSVAGQTLEKFSTDTFARLWSVKVGPEARGLAIDPRGRKAVVSFLSTSAAAHVSMDIPKGAKRPSLRFEALQTEHTPTPPEAIALAGRQAVPERFARNAFAATFIGDRAVLAYQQSTPMAAKAAGREIRGSYGGGGGRENPAILHRLAFLSDGWNGMARAHVRVSMPRALRYDEEGDRLFIADMGTDEILVLKNASSSTIDMASRLRIRQHESDERCGPDGIDLHKNGELFVHCSFNKRVAKISLNENHQLATREFSIPLSRSRLSAAERRGRELFHRGNDSRMSGMGALACANCHPEARTDGLSWRIEGTSLQTPLLAGRLQGTHPFKWDGGDKDLYTSLRATVVRLGGSGINDQDARDLQAYLESLAPIRVAKPEGEKRLAAERGAKLFHSTTTKCGKCHDGKNLSDGGSYEFSDDLPKVNTPSLIGLAASAPYFHDGSAKTLRDLVLENGSIHGMGSTSSLSDNEVDDLIAYLETL